MPKVALAAGPGTDHIGERALLAAFSASLPDYDVVPVRASWNHPAATYRDVGRAAVYVMAGETVLADPGSIRAAAVLAPLASATHTPLAFVGVGAGALARPADRWLSRRLVHRADLLLLSDEESSHRLAETGAPVPLRVSADPAWAAVRPPTADRGRGDVVVAVLDGRSGALALSVIGWVLGRLYGAGLRVRLQPWAGQGRWGDLDAAAAHRLAGEIGAHVEVATPPRDLDEARDHMSDAAVVLTQRYRAVQAAAEAGVPVVPLGGQGRMVALARRLSQPAAALEWPVPEISALVERAAAGPGPSPAAVKQEASRAEAGFALLRLVVEQGAADLGTLDRLPLSPQPWP